MNAIWWLPTRDLRVPLDIGNEMGMMRVLGVIAPTGRAEATNLPPDPNPSEGLVRHGS